MGINSKKAPPLPAPTEESTTTSELEPTPTDVSKPGDEKSTYSLPEDGTPVTIKTRGKNNKQTSLLIEYSDHHKNGAPGAEGDRRPSVRVRVTTPSGKGKDGGGRIKITEAADIPNTSYSRRAPPSPLTPSYPAPFKDGGDDQSIGSYASATEESNVSRNQPVDIGIDIGRAGRRPRRPASPLIPQADDTMGGSHLPSTVQSEISAIPTDSFLDGSGPTRSSEGKWASSPNSTEKLKNTKTRTVSRERVKISSSDKKDRSDRKHKSSKSRTSSASDRYIDEPKSTRRRSSRNHESAVSAADSSMLSSNLSPSHRSMDQHSMRSESSSKSINNPKLLEAVEDAIRRLILPQLDSIRRETSLRESARRGSVVSTGTSISREDLTDRRKPSDRSRDPRYRDRRDREGRHDYADASPRAFDRDSIDGSSLLDVEPQTPRRKSGGGDAFKTAAATAAVGGLTAAALAGSPSDDKKQRRRKRAESVRSRSRASDYTDDFDDDDHLPAPPMPLMSEINPSEVTRTSILSADTDRPHSATEEASAAVRQVIRPVGSTDSSTPTPTKTPNIAQDGLGTQHTNISHGDLTALRNKRDSDSSDQHVAYTRVPPPMDDHASEELDDIPDSNYMGSAYDYYNTQDVPPPLRYEPYQPERRGLSPIYSVSGYTEAGSEGPQHRDSRTFAPNEDSPEKTSQRDLSMHSPASAHSNVMGRESDLRSDDRSSVADHRHTMSADGSDLDPPASRQAVRGIGANPDIVDVPVGLESHVASLIDGSMVDQSVLSQDYGPRDSTVSYGDGSRSYVDDHSSPTKQSVDSRQYIEDERSSTPTARNPQQRSREFTEEYDIDTYGRKIPRSQYRQSPTESEAAITTGAAAKAIKALKANQGRQPTAEAEYEEAFVPAGVQRNRSFKERTLAGHELATTPTHSIDRLDYADSAPKLGASGLPDLDDPMPEIGYMDESDTHTNASVVKERLDGASDAMSWAHRSLQSTPKPHEMTRKGTQDESDERHGLGITDMATAAALGAGAAMAASQSRQPSDDRDEDWHRTSDDRKRDTLGTNPFEGVSPVANPQLGDNLYGGANYDIGFHTGSPGGPLEDEGYKSQGPNRTPEFQQGNQDDTDAPKAIELHDGADPFYEPPKTTATRHLSGMSHGMATPLYDPATGGGIDRIESKDIVALMQELVARDAQRTARDTEIAATVMFLAKEMRVSFRSVEDRIRQAEDVLADELQETEKAIVKTIGGPRPYPGSAGRSAQTSQVGEDMAVKKGNVIRRALKGLRTSGTNDLTRIEDMLFTLLKDVDDLKAQTAQQSRSTTRPSLDNLQPDMPYEQEPGYEPEGRDVASMDSSQPTQSGRLPTNQSRPLQRQYSENRVSTVPEANEDEDDPHDRETQHGRGQQDEFGSGGRYSNTNLLTPGQSNQRGSSVPLDTPPQTSHAAAQSGSLSNDNTPRTEKGKKHKSSSSSSWIPKISRWSETTASTVSKAFRGSTTSRKDRDAEYMNPGHSRSGSDLATYADDYYHADPYGEDYLHTGHSDPNLTAPRLNQPDPDQPRLYMTPEDPKYKAHRNSLNLQHPQPRAGQTERFKANLESQAYIYDSTMTPRSQDWQGSTTSLHRVPVQHGQRHSDVSGVGGEYWEGSGSGPPRPPKEPLDAATGTPRRSGHASKPSKTSPLPYHSVESGYGTATATHTNYTGSPKPENRNLSTALGVPSRRPSGPRAMTPKSADEEAARDERRRKRDTFGTVASQESETF